MELTHGISRTVVPAGTGRAVIVRDGQCARVVDVEGGQVGDVFAFCADDPAEYLSAPHTRTHVARLFPHVGESFVTNRRRPILTLAADTSPGIHDMLIAACDPERYQALGVGKHASCAENLRIALAGMGIETEVVPQPINVFMRIPITAQGDLTWLPAASEPGDAITFHAATDCVFVVSACPMDLNAINGHRPTALEIEVL
jgi:uncharacterized protein YcgI (DUF1989 family)